MIENKPNIPAEPSWRASGNASGIKVAFNNGGTKNQMLKNVKYQNRTIKCLPK